MPPFDLSQLQAMWDGIFPAIFGPLAAFVDTIGASWYAALSPAGDGSSTLLAKFFRSTRRNARSVSASSTTPSRTKQDTRPSLLCDDDIQDREN